MMTASPNLISRLYNTITRLEITDYRLHAIWTRIVYNTLSLWEARRALLGAALVNVMTLKSITNQNNAYKYIGACAAHLFMIVSGVRGFRCDVRHCTQNSFERHRQREAHANLTGKEMRWGQELCRISLRSLTNSESETEFWAFRWLT